MPNTAELWGNQIGEVCHFVRACVLSCGTPGGIKVKTSEPQFHLLKRPNSSFSFPLALPEAFPLYLLAHRPLPFSWLDRSDVGVNSSEFKCVQVNCSWFR